MSIEEIPITIIPHAYTNHRCETMKRFTIPESGIYQIGNCPAKHYVKNEMVLVPAIYVEKSFLDGEYIVEEF